MALVYRLTSPSGKVYIGMTATTLNKRMFSHTVDRARMLKRGKKLGRFYSAWSKYPIAVWKKEVLATDLSRIEANAIEREQIRLHKSQDVDFGYNMADGGNGGDTGRNGEVEKRANHSLLLKELNKNEEFKACRIEKARATIAANPERFQQMADKRKKLLRRGSSHQNHTGIWVVNYTQYATLKEAVAAEQHSASTIVTWCNDPDRKSKATNSRTGIIRGMTPRSLGFYRINMEITNGKV